MDVYSNKSVSIATTTTITTALTTTTTVIAAVAAAATQPQTQGTKVTFADECNDQNAFYNRHPVCLCWTP